MIHFRFWSRKVRKLVIPDEPDTQVDVNEFRKIKEDSEERLRRAHQAQPIIDEVVSRVQVHLDVNHVSERLAEAYGRNISDD